MRRILALSTILGVLLALIPACGSHEPVNHPEELPDGRIPKATKKN